ncbi:MAG: hypothetical protein HFJ54_08435 [Clostridia bacterium]|nr:hypothetical protein [Clostridia bacterium]
MKDDRRKGRRRIPEREENGFSLKNTLYIAGTILALGTIAFFVTIMIYNKNIEKIYSDLEGPQVAQTTEDGNTDGETEEASTNLGKSINEIEDELKQTSIENEEVAKNTGTSKKEEKKTETKNTVENKTTNTNAKEEKKEQVNEIKNEVKENKEETIKEPEFSFPVEGEMVKEYAKDKLVYSETLKEWITHTGVDIKAEKTTVVKAAEERNSNSYKKRSKIWYNGNSRAFKWV